MIPDRRWWRDLRIFFWALCHLEVFLVLQTFLVLWSMSDLKSPPATPLLEDRIGQYLSEGDKDRDLGYWDVAGSVNPRLVACLLAIEDQRYFLHGGLDPWGLLRAAWVNLQGGGRQGASTIAMQVIRMENPASRTLWAKIAESLAAELLILRHGPIRVLEQYLKLIPQGNRMHGAAYAARRYFRKPLQDLSLAESALLASLPKAPSRMNLFTYQGLTQAKQRAELVLRLLYQRQQIGSEEYLSARKELTALSPESPEVRRTDSYHFILRTLDQIPRDAKGSYRGPLRTTLDPAIQEFCSGLVEDMVSDNRLAQVGNAAILVADRQKGDLLAYVGSAGYFDRDNSGAINYAHVPRSSGSTLKPFLFAQALDEGKVTPGTVLADLPFSVLDPHGTYRAANFDDDFLGPMILRRALANSRNIPALRILETAGFPECFTLLRNLGLLHDDRGPDYYGYGVAIGGLYVTLEDLVRAYGTLANDGREFQLKWFKDQPEPEGRPLLSTYAARTISLFLSDNSARYPTFPQGGPLEFPFPVAVKTGTSQGFRDAWTVAYSDKYLVGFWAGDPQNQPMNRVAGSRVADYVRRIFAHLQPDQMNGIDTTPFPPPEGTVPLRICSLSGEIADDDCPNTLVEYFRPDQAPHQICTVHQRLAVDRLTGNLATRETPTNRVALRTFVVLPPEYALWGARKGLDLPPLPASNAPRVIRLVSPLNGSRFFLDPSIPKTFQTIPLQAIVQPPVGRLIWVVDGKEIAQATYPYLQRWSLEHGSHTITARVPGETISVEELRINVE